MLPILAGMAAAAFIKALAKHKAASKQAGAAKAADDERYNADKALWNSNESIRGSRVQAGGSALKNVQGSLGGGAPDYSIDPNLLSSIGAPRPYGGSHAPDPRAGLGWQFVQGLAGGAGDALNTAYMGNMYSKAGVGGNVGASGFGNDAESGMAPSASVCAFLPSHPGCKRNAFLGGN